MNELPNSVRKRMAGLPQPAEHPDADLLSAFCEHSLPDSEREHILAHIAVCSECRQVVALAMPEPTSAAPLMPVSTSALLGRAVFRWAAIAACVAIISVVVWRNTRVIPPAAEVAKLESPAVNQSESGSVAPIAPAPAPTPSQAEAKAKSQPSDMPEGATRSGALRVPMSNVQVERRVGGLVSGKESGDRAEGNELPRIAGQQQSRSADARTSSAAPVLTPNADNSLVAQLSVPQDRARSQGGLQQNVTNQQQVMKARTLSIPPEAANARVQNLNAAANQPTNNYAQADTIQVMAVSPKFSKKEPAVRALWNATREGYLQTSADGQSWHRVQPAADAVVHSVASVGSEVWAGGADGTVYYSRDNGKHWTSTRTAAAGTIVGLMFSDSKHGTFTTSTGERWVTGDGGHSWTRQRP